MIDEAGTNNYPCSRRRLGSSSIFRHQQIREFRNEGRADGLRTAEPGLRSPIAQARLSNMNGPR
jgi:hypothetical protein